MAKRKWWQKRKKPRGRPTEPSGVFPLPRQPRRLREARLEESPSGQRARLAKEARARAKVSGVGKPPMRRLPEKPTGYVDPTEAAYNIMGEKRGIPAPRPQGRRMPEIPSGYMVLTDEQMEQIGGAVYSAGTDETGRRIVPIDWYTKQLALARGESVRAPGIQPAPGGAPDELTLDARRFVQQWAPEYVKLGMTEEEARQKAIEDYQKLYPDKKIIQEWGGRELREAAYGERRLYLEQPYGSLLSEGRIPEGGTERGRQVRELAEREGISHAEAARRVDARNREIRRLAQRRNITFAEAAEQYGQTRTDEADWTGAKTPRDELEVLLTEQAQDLTARNPDYAAAAMAFDLEAIAGERADNPAIADKIREGNHLIRAIGKGRAGEEGYRRLVEIARLIASEEPFADPEITQGLALFGEGGGWLPYYTSETELDEPKNQTAIGRAEEQVADIMADPSLTDEQKVRMARRVGAGLREELAEPAEEVKPMGEFGAKPGDMAKVIAEMLETEPIQVPKGQVLYGKKKDDWYYPEGSILESVWDATQGEEGGWREPNEQDIGERLNDRYEQFADVFGQLGVALEVIDAQWRLGVLQAGMLTKWDEHQRGREATGSEELQRAPTAPPTAEPSISAAAPTSRMITGRRIFDLQEVLASADLAREITARLDAGESLEAILASIDVTALTDEELLALDAYVQGLP